MQRRPHAWRPGLEELAVTMQDHPIQFVDGLFAYEVRLFGAPEEVSKQEAEDIAAKLL